MFAESDNVVNVITHGSSQYARRLPSLWCNKSRLWRSAFLTSCHRIPRFARLLQCFCSGQCCCLFFLENVLYYLKLFSPGYYWRILQLVCPVFKKKFLSLFLMSETVTFVWNKHEWWRWWWQWWCWFSVVFFCCSGYMIRACENVWQPVNDVVMWQTQGFHASLRVVESTFIPVVLTRKTWISPRPRD